MHCVRSCFLLEQRVVTTRHHSCPGRVGVAGMDPSELDAFLAAADGRPWPDDEPVVVVADVGR
eukprot:11193953-Heterocapsa_arctica.AAC.1